MGYNLRPTPARVSRLYNSMIDLVYLLLHVPKVHTLMYENKTFATLLMESINPNNIEQTVTDLDNWINCGFIFDDIPEDTPVVVSSSHNYGFQLPATVGTIYYAFMDIQEALIIMHPDWECHEYI
jgi:hypothetical protein